MTKRNERNDNRRRDEETMSVEEAGRRGGEVTSDTHDREFYEDIGRRGGETTSDRHGREFYEDIGQKGGRARAEQRDPSDDEDRRNRDVDGRDRRASREGDNRNGNQGRRTTND